MGNDNVVEKRSCQTVGGGWCATVIFRNGRF